MADRFRPDVRPGEVLFAVAGLPVALVSGLYVYALLYGGAILAVTLVGLPFLAAGLRGGRALGEGHRRLVARWLGERIERPEPLPATDGALAWTRAALTDAVGWRTLLYLGVRLPVGLLTFLAVLWLPAAALWLMIFPVLPLDDALPGWAEAGGAVLGAVLLPAVPAALRAVSGLNRWLARQLLGPSPGQRRLRALRRARGTLAAESARNLRWIERDLHDGTQAQLVAIAITLSLAEDELPADGRLAELVARARAQTDDAIGELRRIIDGIYPAALDDGLGRALPALAAGVPIPVEVRVELAGRPDPAIEHAVYFCVAELLTNVTRHSGASSAHVRVTGDADGLRVEVGDDGRGGAAAGRGSGLSGLGERLAAVDGSLAVRSPAGGPTAITARLPWTV